MNIEHITLHIQDGIKSLRGKGDVEQAEHNFFEIATHLGISGSVAAGQTPKSYEVELNYTIDVLADTEDNAVAAAMNNWNEHCPVAKEMNIEVKKGQ